MAFKSIAGFITTDSRRQTTGKLSGLTNHWVSVETGRHWLTTWCPVTILCILKSRNCYLFQIVLHILAFVKKVDPKKLELYPCPIIIWQ